MFIVGLVIGLIQLLLLVIFRGAVGGGILHWVSKIFKIGRSDFSESFAASAFSHAVEMILLVVLNGFAYIYMLFDPSFHGFFGIGTLYGTTPTVAFTIFRAAILTVFYTYYTVKFLKTSPANAFISSLITVILYFLLAYLIGYIMLHISPHYIFRMLPRWF